MLTYVLYVLGMGKMSQGEIGLLGLFVGIFSIIAGIVVDNIIRSGGFGVIFNSFFIAVGFLGGLFMIGLRFGRIDALDSKLVILLAVGASFSLLFGLAILKNALVRDH